MKNKRQRKQVAIGPSQLENRNVGEKSHVSGWKENIIAYNNAQYSMYFVKVERHIGGAKRIRE